jgi:hypothetical protein
MKMKLVYALPITAAMLLCAYRTVSQAPADSEPIDGIQEESSPFPVIYFDTQTWEVVASDAPDDDLSNYNKPEQLEERQNAALGVLDPIEYAKRFPKTRDEQAQADEAAARVINPPALNFDGKSDEDRKATEDAIFAIMNPMEVQETAEEAQAQPEVENAAEPLPQP